MTQALQRPNSPWISLIILLALMLGFTIALAIIGLLLPFESALAEDANIFMRYTLLASGTIFTFLLPAIALQLIERYYNYFPREKYAGGGVYLLAFLFLLAFSPVMQLVGEWNESLSLPASLKGIEEWMRLQEDSMAELTERMVMVDTVPLLLLNIVVMAILPAVAEEFFFRGNLMHIIQRMARNHHISIWLTAIIFSAIHFQFYGFVPRMLLGAFFGYMFVWTQNIWVPVVAHFINNAFVTILAFSYARQGKSFADLQAYESYSIFVYIGALVLSAMIGYVFYRYTNNKRKMYGTRVG